MSEYIVVIDTSEIREGKLPELKAALGDLAGFVEANEPRPIAYQAYIDEGERRMTVLQVHPDPASMEFHMEVAASAFPGFADLLELRTMDVYGEPSEKLIDQLRRKATMLGDVDLVVHQRQAGFTRFRVG
ncbi:MAG TPA: hypothetical protein VE669_05600 [Actinomycetota bacterium]|nr:hypothetical protein [Actinomycetota bacterium]